MNKILLAGIVLENEKGEYALQLRDDMPGLINAGMWSIFGGHIEKGEEAKSAALREIYEELTIKLSPKKLQEIGTFELENKVFYVFHYQITNEANQAVLREGQDWQWCSRDQILNGKINGRNVVTYHVDFFNKLWAKNI